MNRETRLVPLALDIHDPGEISNKAPEFLPTIEGRGVVYGAWSKGLPWAEIIEPDAFYAADDVIATIDHDINRILGRTGNNTVRMKSDAGGINFEIDPPATTYAKDLLVRIRRGDVAGMSAGFVVEEDRWLSENGEMRRIIRKGKLIEIAVATLPAYPQTTVNLRAIMEKYLGKEQRDRYLQLLGRRHVR